MAKLRVLIVSLATLAVVAGQRPTYSFEHGSPLSQSSRPLGPGPGGPGRGPPPPSFPYRLLSAMQEQGRGIKELFASASSSSPQYRKDPFGPPRGATHYSAPPKGATFFLEPPTRESPSFYAGPPGGRGPPPPKFGRASSPLFNPSSLKNPISLTTSESNNQIPQEYVFSSSSSGSRRPAQSVQDIVAQAAQEQHEKVLRKEHGSHPRITHSHTRVGGARGPQIQHQGFEFNPYSNHQVIGVAQDDSQLIMARGPNGKPVILQVQSSGPVEYSSQPSGSGAVQYISQQQLGLGGPVQYLTQDQAGPIQYLSEQKPGTVQYVSQQPSSEQSGAVQYITQQQSSPQQSSSQQGNTVQYVSQQQSSPQQLSSQQGNTVQYVTQQQASPQQSNSQQGNIVQYVTQQQASPPQSGGQQEITLLSNQAEQSFNFGVQQQQVQQPLQYTTDGGQSAGQGQIVQYIQSSDAKASAAKSPRPQASHISVEDVNLTNLPPQQQYIQQSPSVSQQQQQFDASPFLSQGGFPGHVFPLDGPSTVFQQGQDGQQGQQLVYQSTGQGFGDEQPYILQPAGLQQFQQNQIEQPKPSQSQSVQSSQQSSKQQQQQYQIQSAISESLPEQRQRSEHNVKPSSPGSNVISSSQFLQNTGIFSGSQQQSQ